MMSSNEQEAIRATAIRGALFSGLSEDLACRLFAAATIRQAQRDAVMFHQGDAPEQLVQVVSGLVRMTQINAEGVQTTLRLMRSGELIGCVAVLQQFPYLATATAVEDSVILSWRAPQFIGLLKQHQPIMDNTLTIIGTRTKDMIQRDASAGEPPNDFQHTSLKPLNAAVTRRPDPRGADRTGPYGPTAAPRP